jgi:hypothetical protein
MAILKALKVTSLNWSTLVSGILSEMAMLRQFDFAWSTLKGRKPTPHPQDLTL